MFFSEIYWTLERNAWCQMSLLYIHAIVFGSITMGHHVRGQTYFLNAIIWNIMNEHVWKHTFLSFATTIELHVMFIHIRAENEDFSSVQN